MDALTQEEGKSIVKEIDNEEWQQPTPHMIDTLKHGVTRSEKGIVLDKHERGEDRTTTINASIE